MDGNADVHGKTIRETLFRHQQLIVSTYFDECGQLAEALSQSANRVTVSAALAARIESYTALLPAAQASAPARHDRMPYRIYFGQIGERLKATYEGRPNAYQNSEELLADAQIAADSLRGESRPARRLFPGAALHTPRAHVRLSHRDARRHAICPRA